MSNKNLSTIAAQIIEAYGTAATNVINSYRLGGERVIGFIDERFALALNSGMPSLSPSMRATLVDNQQRMSGLYVKGLQFGTDRAQSMVGVAVDLATKGVSLVASNATRLDHQTNLNALEKLNRVAMPAASLLNSVAVGIEEGSTELVKNVAGESMPAKVMTTSKLNTAQRQATTSRKRIAKATTQQATEVVKEVAQDVANVVETSKVIAQRVAEPVAKQVNKQVKKPVAPRNRVTKAVAQQAMPVSDAVQAVVNLVEASEVVTQSAAEPVQVSESVNKQVIEQVSEQMNEQVGEPVKKPVASRKRVVKATQTTAKAATKRASKVIANTNTAIATPNATRSVARKVKKAEAVTKVADAANATQTAKATDVSESAEAPKTQTVTKAVSKPVNKAVVATDTNTGASNTTRRVTRKTPKVAVAAEPAVIAQVAETATTEAIQATEATQAAETAKTA